MGAKREGSDGLPTQGRRPRRTGPCCRFGPSWRRRRPWGPRLPGPRRGWWRGGAAWGAKRSVEGWVWKGGEAGLAMFAVAVGKTGEVVAVDEAAENIVGLNREREERMDVLLYGLLHWRRENCTMSSPMVHGTGSNAMRRVGLSDMVLFEPQVAVRNEAHVLPPYSKRNAFHDNSSYKTVQTIAFAF